MGSVDVIVPCYRYAQFLRNCVRSVLEQEGVEVRVLIIDDASPDDTPAVAAELVRGDRRVEYRRHATNQGHITTYNEGLDWISGDYALLLSADDMLTRGALARAAAVMDAHREVGLVYGRVINTSQPGNDGWVPPSEYAWRVIDGQELIERMCAMGENIVPTPTAIVRTRLQQEVGGYRKELPHTADMEMWLRLSANGAVGVLEVEQAYYRVHGQNMSKGFKGLTDLQARQAAIERVFERYGDRIQDIPRLRKLVGRVLGEEAFWAGNSRFDVGDASGCAECLRYARELYPSLSKQPKWIKLRCKQALGPRLWATVRPMIQRMRTRELSQDVRTA